MIRKTTNILLIAVLALNLMGAWATAMPLNCGMECCRPTEAVLSDAPMIEAPGCCDRSGVTCTFESGQYEELFDDVLCCISSGFKVNQASIPLGANVDGDVGASQPPRFTIPVHVNGPPSETPLFLTNAAFLC